LYGALDSVARPARPALIAFASQGACLETATIVIRSPASDTSPREQVATTGHTQPGIDEDPTESVQTGIGD